MTIYLNDNVKELFWEYVFERCDKVSFHLPNFEAEKGNSKCEMTPMYAKYLSNCKGILESVEPFVIEKRIANQHGRSVYGYMTYIYILKLCDTIKKILQVEGDLANWKYPNLPEDLCFFRRGETMCWITSVAHEANIVHIHDASNQDIEFFSNYRIEYDREANLDTHNLDYRNWGIITNNFGYNHIYEFWESVEQEMDKKLTLLEACKIGKYEDVVSCVDSGEDINQITDGQTPLEVAIINIDDVNEMRYSIVEFLVLNGACIDHMSKCGETIKELLLETQIYESDSFEKEKNIWSLYKLVCQMGEDEQGFKYGEFHKAVLANNFLAAQNLLKQLNDTNYKRKGSEYSVLMDYLELYMDWDEDISECQIEWNRQNEKMIKLLVDNGIGVTWKNKSGYTASDIIKMCV